MRMLLSMRVWLRIMTFRKPIFRHLRGGLRVGDRAGRCMLMGRNPRLYMDIFQSLTFVELGRMGCWGMMDGLEPSDGEGILMSARRTQNVPFVGGL